jgi:hypothetical protein
MPSQSITKLYEHARRARETLRKSRETEREKTTALVVRAGTSGATIGGLLLAAAIDGKWGHDSDTEKHGIASVGPAPINLIIGVASVAIGLPWFMPGSEYLSAFGAATLGYPLAKTLEDRIVSGSGK